MKKFKEVNGRKFDVMGSIDKPTFMFRKELYDCYDRPSRAKQSIFWAWKQYCLDSFKDFYNFGIESYNVSMFTLGWTTPEGEYYVTKTRQEFYPYK